MVVDVFFPPFYPPKPNEELVVLSKLSVYTAPPKAAKGASTVRVLLKPYCCTCSLNFEDPCGANLLFNLIVGRCWEEIGLGFPGYYFYEELCYLLCLFSIFW